jgi:hypothetical protein
MPQETEQRRLSVVKSMQSIIDSIIYAMYTRENFEYCWRSCFGSHSKNSLYSICTNGLKLARPIQRDDHDEVYNEDGCNDDMMAGPRTLGLGCFSPVQGLDERNKASENENSISFQTSQQTAISLIFSPKRPPFRCLKTRQLNQVSPCFIFPVHRNQI